jgi:hypothetical protein
LVILRLFFTHYRDVDRGILFQALEMDIEQNNLSREMNKKKRCCPCEAGLANPRAYAPRLKRSELSIKT